MVKPVALKKIKSVKAKKTQIVEPDVSFVKPVNKKSLWQSVAWGRVFAVLAVGIILIGGAVWFFGGNGLVIDNIKDGQLTSQQQSLLLEKISKHIVLPQDSYQMAIATEPDKLKALSPFYNRVKAGDVVVVYKLFALIYDEREDILVNATILNQQ